MPHSPSWQGTVTLATAAGGHAGGTPSAGDRPDWAAGAGVVLEKHGYLPADPVTPEVLVSGGLLDAPGVYLLTRQPDAFWTPDVIRAVVDGRAAVFVDGPPAPALAAELGIVQAGAISTWQGAVMPDDSDLIVDAQAFGAAPGGRVSFGEGSASAERWAGLGSCRRLASYVGDERAPAIAQSGALTVSAFGLLSVLAEQHAATPGPHPTLGLEVMLLAIVDRLHRAAGVPRVRVTGWAGGAPMAAALVHEVRWPIVPRDVAIVGNRDHDAGLAPTWSWPASLIDDGAIAEAGADGPPVALGAEGSAPDAAFDALARAQGRAPEGVTPARTPEATGFGGATDLSWVAARGLAWAALDTGTHLHPHRPLLAGEGGGVTSPDLVCLPRAVTTQTLFDDDAVTAALLARVRAAGGIVMVSATPDPADDIAAERVGTLVRGADRRDLGALTAWWSHSRGLRIEGIDGRRVLVTAPAAVSDVAFELLDADGVRATVRADLAAGRQELVVPPPGAAEIDRTEVARALEEICATRGVRADTAWVVAAGAEEARTDDRLAALDRLLPARRAAVLVHGDHAGGLALRLAAARPDLDVVAVCNEHLASLAGACVAARANLSARVRFLAQGQLEAQAAEPARLVVALPGDAEQIARLAPHVAPGGRLVAFESPAAGREVRRLGLVDESPAAAGVRVLVRPLVTGGPLVITPKVPRDLEGWKPIERAFGDAVRTELDRRQVGSPAARDATLRTNTVLVPHRGETLLAYLRQGLGLDTFEGLRLVEIGCGFGALAAYLTWRGGTVSTTAVDLDEAALEVARVGARAAGLPHLRFAAADARTLDPIGDGAADVVVANNSLLYLTTKEALDEALAAIARVLAPGGSLVIYQANRLRPREPFTRAPLIHLLPPRAGRLAGRVTRLPHNHGRVRLVSPRELRRRLRAAGFVDVVTAAPGAPRRLPRDVSGFFGAVARAPMAPSAPEVSDA